MTLREINNANSTGVLTLSKKLWPWHEQEQSITLAAGTVVVFTTRFQFGEATVLEIDHGRTHPVRLQWVNDNGDTRIEWFAADEFISLRYA